MRAIPLTALTLIAALSRSPAQGPIAPAEVPAWADSAFRHSSQFSGYDYSSLTASVGIGDFDGDGLDDCVVEVRSRGGLDRGLAVIHRIDGAVHILGAGRDVGDGSVEIRNWGVTELRHHKSAILVLRSDNRNGLLVWDGKDYHWVAN